MERGEILGGLVNILRLSHVGKTIWGVLLTPVYE